jgi:large conductance mechanosensitive channel
MKIKKPLQGFLDFIRAKGVIGLAIGIVMGTSVTKLVAALVTDIINPLIGILLGRIGDLSKVYIQIASAQILIGSFISSIIDFLIIAFVVYFAVKILGIDKLDKKPDNKKK